MTKRNYTPRRASARWLEDAPEHIRAHVVARATAD